MSAGLRDHLTITSTTPAVLSDQLHLSNPTATDSFDDLVVGTKVRVRDEQAGPPGVAFDVSTRLPNAKHGSGLGQDSMDFYARLLVAQPTPVVHVTINVGLGVLGDPLQGNRHVQSVLYGAELSRPLTRQLAVVVGAVHCPSIVQEKNAQSPSNGGLLLVGCCHAGTLPSNRMPAGT